MARTIAETLRKVAVHAREGTLFARLREEFRNRAGGERADPDHYHGDVAKGYLTKRIQQQSWHTEQTIVNEMLRQIPDGSTVLDVPFGTGRFVAMFLQKRMSIYGIDISQDMLNAAREALQSDYDRCQITLGSAESLPYENEFFDLVVCFRFFGLISFEMAKNVLAEIHRVMRTQGRLIIRVPVRKDLVEDDSKPKNHESVQGRLLEAELFAMFDKYGFDVSESQLVEERPKVLYKVYLLLKRDRSVPATRQR